MIGFNNICYFVHVAYYVVLCIPGRRLVQATEWDTSLMLATGCSKGKVRTPSLTFFLSFSCLHVLFLFLIVS